MKYECIKIVPAENGFILSYMERKPMSNEAYCNTIMDDCQEVFKENEGSKALARMRELYSGDDKE